MPTPNELTRQADLLVGQIAHWSNARWRSRGDAAGDAVLGLVQRLADAGADAEGRERRAVPRLADTTLADQVRVTVADLLAADAPGEVLARLAADVEAHPQSPLEPPRSRTLRADMEARPDQLTAWRERRSGARRAPDLMF